MDGAQGLKTNSCLEGRIAAEPLQKLWITSAINCTKLKIFEKKVILKFYWVHNFVTLETGFGIQHEWGRGRNFYYSQKECVFICLLQLIKAVGRNSRLEKNGETMDMISRVNEKYSLFKNNCKICEFKEVF